MVNSAIAQGARGAGVVLAGQVAKVGLQFVSLVLLARLLSPDDFGLVAMVNVFIAFGTTIRDLGLSTVGLQRKDLSPQQASNLFWVSSGMGLGASVILASAAGLLVVLYNEPRLWWLAPAMAPTLLLNGMAAQVNVQLARSMRYVAKTMVEVGSILLQIVVTAALALLGLGYWAIAAGTLLAALVGLVAAWVASGWLPTRPRRTGDSRQLVRDGAAFGMAQLLSFISQNIDTVLIGMRWDSASVGLYNRGYQLLSMPVSQVMGPLTPVVIPTLHRAQEEGRTFDDILLRVQFGLGIVLTWTFAIVGGIAEWLIPALLGSEWSGVIPIFQSLVLGGFFWVFSYVSYWRFIAENLGAQLTCYNLITKTLTAFAIIGASFVSLEAVGWAVSICLVLSWPINLIWLWKTAQQPYMPYIKNGLRLVAPGLIVYLASRVSLHAMGAAWWAALPIAVVATILMFGGIAVFPTGRKELHGSFDIVRGLLKRS